MSGTNIRVDIDLDDCTVVVPVTYWPEVPAGLEEPGEPQDYDLAGSWTVYMGTSGGEQMPGHELRTCATPPLLRERVYAALDALLDSGRMADMAATQRQQDAIDRAGL